MKKTRKLKLHRETLRNLQNLDGGQTRWVLGGIVCTNDATTCPTKPQHSCRCTTTDTCP